MNMVNVTETFKSIQGESSFAGISCFFIRLSGCNLRCGYCDTKHSYEAGNDVSIEALVNEFAESGAEIAEVTGGEPLLQDNVVSLLVELRDLSGKPVLIETNGSCDISVVPEGVIAVVDVKCPGSGESDSFDMENIVRLRSYDEVKFVLSDRSDYDWACNFIRDNDLGSICEKIFFSPVYGVLDGNDLGGWIIEDAVPARLQIQLHKVIDVE